MNNLKKSQIFKICLFLPVVVTLISSFFSENASSVYAQLERPPLSPPGILFPIIWFSLALLNGGALYYIYISDNASRDQALKLFAAAYFFIFFWPILFFEFRLGVFSLVWLLALIAINTGLLLNASLIDKKAFYLLIPYCLWCIFAVYLNLGTILLN